MKINFLEKLIIPVCLLIGMFVAVSCDDAGSDDKVTLGTVDVSAHILTADNSSVLPGTTPYIDLTSADNISGICTKFIIVNGSVKIGLIAQRIPSLPSHIATSKLHLKSVSLNYTPLDSSSPALPNRTSYTQTLVEAGDNSSFEYILSVDLFTSQNASLIVVMPGSHIVAHYEVNMELELEELDTGINKKVPVRFDVQAGDINTALDACI